MVRRSEAESRSKKLLFWVSPPLLRFKAKVSRSEAEARGKVIKMMIEVIWILFNRKGKNNAFLIVFMVCTFSFVKDDNA